MEASRRWGVALAVLALAACWVDAAQLEDDLSPMELGASTSPAVMAMESQVRAMRKPVPKANWQQVKQAEAKAPKVAASPAAAGISAATIAADLKKLNQMAASKVAAQAKKAAQPKKTAKKAPPVAGAVLPKMPVIPRPTGIEAPPKGIPDHRGEDTTVEAMMAKIKAMRHPAKPVSWKEVQKEEKDLHAATSPVAPLPGRELGEATSAAPKQLAVNSGKPAAVQPKAPALVQQKAPAAPKAKTPAAPKAKAAPVVKAKAPADPKPKVVEQTKAPTQKAAVQPVAAKLQKAPPSKAPSKPAKSEKSAPAGTHPVPAGHDHTPAAKSSAKPAAAQKSQAKPAAAQKSQAKPAAAQKSPAKPTAAQKSPAKPTAAQKSPATPTTAQKTEKPSLPKHMPKALAAEVEKDAEIQSKFHAQEDKNRMAQKVFDNAEWIKLKEEQMMRPKDGETVAQAAAHVKKQEAEVAKLNFGQLKAQYDNAMVGAKKKVPDAPVFDFKASRYAVKQKTGVSAEDIAKKLAEHAARPLRPQSKKQKAAGMSPAVHTEPRLKPH